MVYGSGDLAHKCCLGEGAAQYLQYAVQCGDGQLKVGMLSYPMLFQRDGGLQAQIRETADHLRKLGVDVHLVDVLRQKLRDFDIIHIFGAIHGNDKLVEEAKVQGCYVVLSPLTNASLVPQTSISLAAAKFLGRLTAKVSGWTVTTNLELVRRALTRADHLVALSSRERTMLNKVYGVSAEKISVVPNGVSAQFFAADEAPFLARFSVRRPFVFCPAQISPWKNQRTLIEALAGTDIGIVLSGAVQSNDRDYFAACMSVPDAHVCYIGALEHNDPLLSSAYRAASAVVLPSLGEAGPLVALESLAAGTPAVITKINGLDLRIDSNCLITVDPLDRQAIRSSVQRVLRIASSRQECVRLVSGCRWDSVAHRIKTIYLKAAFAPMSSASCAKTR